MKLIRYKTQSHPIRVKPVAGLRVESGRRRVVTDRLAIEEALQINVNGEAFTVTMRSPGHDEQLVRGLLFTEGMIPDQAAPLRFVSGDQQDEQCRNTIDVQVAEELLARPIDASARSLAATSSCGFCGKRDLSDLQILSSVERLSPAGLLEVALLDMMMQQMAQLQSTFQASGGCHAAAAFTLPGQLLAVHEDVGRHNAVDKVIGALLEEMTLSNAQCLLVSGRVSYEIVSKAFRAGLPFLVAVSAPSSMAVQTAKMWGITLIGFCRDGRATVYTHVDHVR